MPYSNLPRSSWGKMDRCVERVSRRPGLNKKRAIAICHSTVANKGYDEEPTDKELDDMLAETKPESKLADEAKEKGKSEKGFVPYGIKTFAELKAYRESVDHLEEVYDLTSDFHGLLESVMWDGGIEDKSAAIVGLADEFAALIKKPPIEVEKKSIVDTVVETVKDMFGLNKGKESKPGNESDSSMMIWKEEESGQYMWMARYSNNFRDNDNPPEIISADSHRRFVKGVEDGSFPLPELWLWHRPEWKIGQAVSVAFDETSPDTGFAVAAGYFDKGKEDVAEWLSKQKNVAVSHAMPLGSLVKDAIDPSIIVEHQTVEISPLPLWAAANKLTGFVVVDAQKEADMAIPKGKRDALINNWGISPELLDKLEAANARDAEKAAEELVEHKEQSEPQVTEPATEPEPVVQADPPESKQAEPEPAPDVMEQPPSRKELGDAIAAVLLPMKEQLDELTAKMAAIEKAEQEAVAEKAATIPTASLGAYLQSRIVGDDRTAVDGRSSLAKDKPKEAASEVESKTGIPFIDQMLSQKK